MISELKIFDTTPDCEIVTSRVFGFKKELVFKAWTDPNHLKNWWGPNGFTNTFNEFNLKPRGIWNFIMHAPDHSNFPMKCTFIEIIEPELVSWEHESGFQVVTTFEEVTEKQTRVVFKMLFRSSEERDQKNVFVVEKNEENMDRLGLELEKMYNDYATFLDEETLKLERILPGPIETVWACLTESSHKERWLSGGDVEPKVGGKVTHLFEHSKISDTTEPLPEKYKDMGDTNTMHGKVLVWEPYTLLSYTWDEGDQGISEVTFELTEMDMNKIKLVLIHTKVPDSRNFKIGVSAGWHTHLNILRNILEGGNPGNFWNVHMPLEKEYEQLI